MLDITTVQVPQLQDMTIPPRCSSIDPNEAPRIWERESGRRLRSCLSRVAGDLRDAAVASRSVTCLRGLPFDAVPPPSPYRDESCWREIPLTLANVFGAVDLLGARSFAYARENAGRVVRNVVARIDAREEYSSQGWGRDLGAHMDDAFRAVDSFDAARFFDRAPAPRWLVFGVIYDRPRVPLSVAPVSDVVRRLSAADVEALCRPEFDVQSPASFGGAQTVRGLPLLVADEHGGWFSRFDGLNCTASTTAARGALHAFAQTLDGTDVWHDIALRRGDVIILDNYRTVHKRSEYYPRWDGTDRWLVRVYAVPKAVRCSPERACAPHVWK